MVLSSSKIVRIKLALLAVFPARLGSPILCNWYSSPCRMLKLCSTSSISHADDRHWATGELIQERCTRRSTHIASIAYVNRVIRSMRLYFAVSVSMSSIKRDVKKKSSASTGIEVCFSRSSPPSIGFAVEVSPDSHKVSLLRVAVPSS